MISVIIPVYNVEAYIVRCIESVCAQTYREIEIILIDDGSSDSSGEICDIYAKKDKRIIVLHKENKGLSDARNKGIEIAQGEYIGFVDADDYIHPNMYEILFHNMKETDSNLSICGFQWISEFENIKELEDNIIQVYEGNELLWQLIANNLDTVVSWNKLYKKEIFVEIRYDVGRIHEDEFIIHKILYKAQKAVYTQCKLYVYVRRTNSIVSSSSISSIKDAWEALENRCNFLSDKIGTVYCSSRHQQLAMGIRHYLQVREVDVSNAKELYLFYRTHFIKLLIEIKIWKSATKSDRKLWIIFIISRNLFDLYYKKYFY